MEAACRILVVEDDFLVRFSLVETLRDEGFQVTEAQDANDGLAALRRDTSIALLMTDLALAGPADGFWLADAARAERPGLAVIFMTGRPDRVTARAGVAERVIGKPYLPSDVCSLAREMLGLAQANS